SVRRRLYHNLFDLTTRSGRRFEGLCALFALLSVLVIFVESGVVAVGVKELIELPKSVIEDRFQLQGNEGAACLFAGAPTDGLMG
ncbi:hypothetical protein MJI20_30620, partial [Salmonella enterica subsp. enterica serovar Anatum]|nr:hypothetical protein [Salmonella enterica subsp. enterica serovar Anatum]